MSNETIEGFLASPLQCRLWRQAKKGGEFVSRAQVSIQGDWDPERFAQAWQAVSQRHEILRTRFAQTPGMPRPLQVIEEPGRDALLFRDLSCFSPDEQKAATEQALSLAPESLAEDVPPLRVEVLRLGDDSHQLILAASALCLDAPSLVFLSQELMERYDDAIDAESDVIQYADYAQYCEDEAAQGSLNESADYWRRILHDSSSSDIQERPGTEPDQPFRPAFLSRRIEPELWRQLQLRAQEAGLDSRDVLFSAWMVVLRRLGLDSSWAMGYLADARVLEGLESSLGLFTGYVPIVGEVPAHRDFALLAKSCRDQIEQALIHQNGYRAEHSQQGNGIESWPGAAIRSGFEYLSVPSSWSYRGGRASLRSLRGQVDRLALNLSCRPCADGCQWLVHYDSGSVAHADALQLAGSLEVFLGNWLQSPSASLASLSHWSSDEEASLAGRYCREAARDEEFTPLRAFAEQSRRVPDRLAAVCPDGSLSYGQLEAASNRWARRLRAMGVGPESLVALLLPRCADLIVALLGVLKAGGAYLPLDPEFPEKRLKFMLEDSGASLLIAHPEAAQSLTEGELPAVTPSRISSQAASCSSLPLQSSATAQNLAYVIYTSGSTGIPKGSSITRGGLANYLSWADGFYPRHGTGSIVHTSVAFDLSVTSIWLPLVRGQAARMMPEGGSFEDFADLIDASEEYSFIKMTPSHLQLLKQRAQAESSFSPGSKAFILGGESLSEDLARWWRRRIPDLKIFNEYGPTETVVGSSIHFAEQDVEDESVPIGGPIAGTRLYLLDPDLRPCPRRAAGHLWIGGAGVSRGYHGRPGWTAAGFLPDPYGSREGSRIYRTGDRVEASEQGLFFRGRSDEQVKVRGYRLELPEIELALNSAPQAAQSVVLAVGQESKVVEAFVVLGKDPSNPTGIVDSEAVSAQLIGHLSQTLPEYMRPSRFHFLREMPLTSNGKIDRRRLAQGAFTPAPAKAAYRPPRNPQEEILASIWAQVLDAPDVGIDDNFFSLGGDSMRSLQVRYQAAERGVHFELQDLFEAPTIRGLLTRLSSDTRAPAQPPQPFGLISNEDRARIGPGIEDAYPLSRLQMGTLYHSSASEGSGIYHNINSYRLKAPWSRKCLTQASDRLADRHPILRTSYNLTEFSQPLQLVHAGSTIPLEVIDLKGFDPQEQQLRLRQWMDDEARNAFDWREPPLLRFFVHLLGPEEYQFSLSKHHSILDGWSAAAMLSELFNEYLSLLGKGEAFRDYRPSTNYREFVGLEQATLKEPEFRDFWSRELSGFTFLRLPEADGQAPQPDFPNGNITTREVPISESLNDSLNGLAQRLGVPVKSVLLTAHVRILGYLSGESDILTGLVSNGRPETADGERALGLFLNSVPFRLDLQGERTWQSLIEGAFEKERTLFPFRRYPMLEMKRDKGGGLLFDTLFYFTNFHVFQQFKEKRHIQAIDFSGFEETEMRFTSAFNVHPLSKALKLYVHFRLPDFSQVQIESILRSYQGILESLTSDPSNDPRAADWLSPEERTSQLLSWNGSGKLEPRQSSLLQQLERTAEEFADSIALWSESGHVSYAALHRSANRWARFLRGRGIDREDLVGLSLGRSAQAVAAILGVLKCGAAYVALDPQNPPRRVKGIIQDTGLQLLLCRRETKRALQEEGIPDCLLLDADAVEREIHALDAGPVDPQVRSENLAYVLMTSGSTGRPKGVMITHANLLLSTMSRFDYYANPVERFLLLSPLYFDSSIAGFYWTLAQGGCLVLPAEGQQREVSEMADLCQTQQVSHLLAIPRLYAWLADSLKGCNVNLNTAIVAGEACTGSVVAQHAASLADSDLYDEYGPTEGTVWSAVSKLGPQDASDPVPIGRPVGSMRAYLLNRDGQLLPVGARGEICIGGGGIARGYWGRAAETAQRFVPDAHGQHPGARLYRTGDLGRWRRDGQLLFEGRDDDEVKIRGYRVSLGEVESALRGHPEVEGSAAAMVDSGAQPRLAAFAVLKQGSRESAQGLREFLLGRLPDPMVPSQVGLVQALPQLPNGKLDRRSLLQQAEDTVASRDDSYQAPANALEEAVSGIWAELFEIDRVGVEDDFGALGGDSILAVQLMAQLSEIFMCPLSVRSVFDTRTVRGLSRIIASKAGEAGQDAMRLAEIWNAVSTGD